jgi:hypothetical protein
LNAASGVMKVGVYGFAKQTSLVPRNEVSAGLHHWDLTVTKTVFLMSLK